MSTESLPQDPSLPLISISDVRLHVWPFLMVILLAVAAMAPGVLAIKLTSLFLTPGQLEAMPWLVGCASETGFVIGSLVCIAILSRGRFGEFGLKWPRRKTYLGTAFVWGIIFAALMIVVDYFPQLIARVPPPVAPLSRSNMVGQLFFEGIFPGFGEEILFRGLLVTYLSSKISGRIRFLNFDMHIAGVLIAVMFALAHMSNFFSRPFWEAFGQQGYAFLFGVFYAYWLEKSGSVAAPIVGHNVGNFLEYVGAFFLAWLWR